MTKWNRYVVCVICILFTNAAYAYGIVSLAPNITEMVYAAGAGKYLVGVDAYSDYPPAAKKLRKVATFSGIDLERVIALHPDLVIAWRGGNPQAQLDKLKRFGIKILYSDPQRLLDIPAMIEKIGSLAGTSAVARVAAAKFRDQYHQLQQRYQHFAQHNRPKVFYQVWQQPLTTINGRSLISKIINFCGGRNIFANLPMIAPQVTLESVLVADPDLIISGEKQATLLAYWARWQQVSAVKHHALYSINPDLIARPGPRILQGVQRVCIVLHRHKPNYNPSSTNDNAHQAT